MCHRPLFISVIAHLLLLITVHQENRIVHSDTELKYRCQCLRDIRNLSKKYIRSKIIYDCDSDTQKEQYWNKNRFHRNCQNQCRKCDCDQYIKWCFLFGKLFGVLYNRRHST